MASTHYLACRIDAKPDAVVTISAVASGLSRSDAMSLAVDLAATGEVMLVGTPRLRSVEVRLPREAVGLVGGPRESASRLAQWVDALRAHGVLRFEALASGSVASVPSRWLTDPQLLATLRVVLAPPGPLAPDDHSPFEDWFARVPKTSVAGLLRTAGQDVEVEEWLASAPRAAWAPLAIPLVDARETADGWCMGWWARFDPHHAFLAGETTQLALTAEGIDCDVCPVDRDAGWRLAPVGASLSTDPPWRTRGDRRLDRVLRGLPKLAESVLVHTCAAAIGEGATIDTVLQAMAPLRRRVERRLENLESTLGAELLRRTGVAGMRAPRLSHARYLHAAVPAPIIARRRQALAAWPQLADELATGCAAATRDALDAARPLVPALAADFGVPPWVVRRLLPLLVPGDVEAHLRREPRTLARLLGAIGPAAPRLTRDHLGTIARWLTLVPFGEDGPDALLLMRALGAEAARSGWSGVADLLEQDGVVDDGPHLLAWWDQLRANVADTLARAAGHAPPDDIVGATLFVWLDGVPVGTQLRLAGGWHRYLWGPRVHDAVAFEDEPEVPAHFGPLTLVESRVRVEPLLRRGALRDEGQALRHCVGSYWAAVATGRRLVMSLQADSGERATAAWARRDVDRWTCEELNGERNRKVPADHPLVRAGAELAELLADTAALSPDALAWHRAAATRLPARGADYAVHGACLLSALPERMQAEALRWMPGAGSLDQRLALAYAKTVDVGHGNR